MGQKDNSERDEEKQVNPMDAISSLFGGMEGLQQPSASTVPEGMDLGSYELVHTESPQKDKTEFRFYILDTKTGEMFCCIFNDGKAKKVSSTRNIQ